MKTTVILIVGSIISFLTLLMVALIVRSSKPELFGGAPAGPQQPAANVAKPAGHDSTHAGGVQDSTALAAQTSDSTRPHTDTVLVAQLTSKAKMLETQVDSLKRQLNAPKPKADTTMQQDWTSTAKLIEAMSADEACKILKEMNDSDVKQVLGKVKKRQAGKILAALDPSRAAKLLR
ncbi:MAG TPA: hypothetical protein VMH23_18270 [Bacteroidota bacterium]|nr:hypothetical protein [Bacteroidota bacterium]